MNFRRWLSTFWFRNRFVEDSHIFANEPRKSWRLEPDPGIGSVVSKYMNSTGMDPKKLDITYDPLNHRVGKHLADEYEKLQHNPNDPDTKKAYETFKREILAQFKHLLEEGYTFSPNNEVMGQAGGYLGAEEMRNDLLQNKHINVFVGGALPPDHPLTELSPYTFGGHRFTYNELFRAIHDIFGHAHHGNHFGPRGEEHAYRLHSRMFSPEALPAMASETRGQNAWLHYGPNQHIPLEDRPYAQQKAALMPRHLTGDLHQKTNL